MTPDQEIERQLRRDEGEKLHAYTDSEGYLTIGIGRMIDKRKGGGISPAESQYLFENDLKDVKEELFLSLPWTRHLDPARHGVLLNMTFQMGIGGVLGFVNTLDLIRTGRYAEAAANMLKSKWATQTPARAKRLAEQMESGVWQ